MNSPKEANDFMNYYSESQGLRIDTFKPTETKGIKDTKDRKSTDSLNSLEKNNMKNESQNGSQNGSPEEFSKVSSKEINKEIIKEINKDFSPEKNGDTLFYPPDLGEEHSSEWSYFMEATFYIVECLFDYNKKQNKEDQSPFAQIILNNKEIKNHPRNKDFSDPNLRCPVAEIPFEEFILYAAEKIKADENLIILANMILDKAVRVPNFCLNEDNQSM